MTESIDQCEPPATQFFLLEDSASSEPSAEAFFPSTEVHFPLLEEIQPSELSAEAFFPSTESIDQGEQSARSFFLLQDSALRTFARNFLTLFFF